jgi:RNA polymerase sigma-70 factor (ECF subfamily)
MLARAPRDRAGAKSRSMAEPAFAPPNELAALTANMARGDEAAWHEFHERYFHRLLRYLFVVSRGREEMAREAVQAALLRAVRHIRRFDCEEAFWSWLAVLGRSALVDEDRKRRRYSSLLDRFLRRDASAGIEVAPDADARLLALLEENLAALPAEDRALLEQKYLIREPVRAIANAAGATEKAVESRLVRIRRHLRELILSQLKREETH